jgi:hypothetical protein
VQSSPSASSKASERPPVRFWPRLCKNRQFGPHCGSHRYDRPCVNAARFQFHLGEIGRLLADPYSFRDPIYNFDKKGCRSDSCLHRVQHSLDAQDAHRTFEVVCQDVKTHLRAYARERLC